MPIIRKANTIAIDEPPRTSATANGDAPTLLVKDELDQVAAAGGKGGVTGGDVRCRQPARAQ